MIDTKVQNLLEHAVDSLIKLHLLLIFYENPRIKMTPWRMAEQSCRDIWSVSEALQELAESGLLSATQSGNEPLYYYDPRPEYIDGIQRLVHGYNDPLERNVIYRFIRDLSSIVALRRDTNNGLSAMSFR